MVHCNDFNHGFLLCYLAQRAQLPERSRGPLTASMSL
jgi:hypothetical protein